MCADRVIDHVFWLSADSQGSGRSRLDVFLTHLVTQVSDQTSADESGVTRAAAVSLCCFFSLSSVEQRLRLRHMCVTNLTTSQTSQPHCRTIFSWDLEPHYRMSSERWQHHVITQRLVALLVKSVDWSVFVASSSNGDGKKIWGKLPFCVLFPKFECL